MSASITTNGMTARPPASRPTTRPCFDDPPSTLLPTGGSGHKGYNLALAIEALSEGLSGQGRADRPTGWGASVYLQVMDPAAFGGAAEVVR